MFALDNLLRQAIQDAITVLLPGTASPCTAHAEYIGIPLVYALVVSAASILPPSRPLSELKLQLQSSFETEDSTSEEQYADPDTPVVIVPDQLFEPGDTQQTTSISEILPTASPNSPPELVPNSSCPLSEELIGLRLETSR